MKISIAFRSVGVLCLLFSLFGFSYNYLTFSRDLSGLAKEVGVEINEQYFINSYYIMTAVCITVFSLLAINGIQLIRQKPKWAIILLLISFIEIAYYLILSYLWQHSEYGLSVAAATGIANGGLSPQIFSLFILWGPAIAYWARTKTLTSQTTGTATPPGV